MAHEGLVTSAIYFLGVIRRDQTRLPTSGRSGRGDVRKDGRCTTDEYVRPGRWGCRSPLIDGDTDATQSGYGIECYDRGTKRVYVTCCWFSSF